MNNIAADKRMRISEECTMNSRLTTSIREHNEHDDGHKLEYVEHHAAERDLKWSEVLAHGQDVNQLQETAIEKQQVDVSMKASMKYNTYW